MLPRGSFPLVHLTAIFSHNATRPRHLPTHPYGCHMLVYGLPRGSMWVCHVALLFAQDGRFARDSYLHNFCIRCPLGDPFATPEIARRSVRNGIIPFLFQYLPYFDRLICLNHAPRHPKRKRQAKRRLEAKTNAQGCTRAQTDAPEGTQRQSQGTHPLESDEALAKATT
jgi:hypothetical protein